MSVSVPIVTLPFKNDTIKKILSFGITSELELDMVHVSNSFLSILTDEQKQELDVFYSSKQKKKKAQCTGYDMYYAIGSRWRDIPTTSPALNTLFHGGLKQGTITEISGRGGTGKTQFCMMFCATVQNPNTATCSYQAIYIDTENTYNALRQHEIIKKLNKSNASLNNIFVWKPQSLPDLLELLQLLPSFISQHPNIRFIAIDSITYFFRQFTDMIERSAKLYHAIQSLISICKQYPIVVTNHVTSYSPDTPEAIIHSKQIIQPLLGPMWWHSVTNQFLLSISQEGQRSCTIKKSSYLAPGTCDFQISSNGIL